MLMKQDNQRRYLVPDIEVNYAEIERGFAFSALEDPFENPEQNW